MHGFPIQTYGKHSRQHNFNCKESTIPTIEHLVLCASIIIKTMAPSAPKTPTNYFYLVCNKLLCTLSRKKIVQKTPHSVAICTVGPHNTTSFGRGSSDLRNVCCILWSFITPKCTPTNIQFGSVKLSNKTVCRWTCSGS